MSVAYAVSRVIGAFGAPYTIRKPAPVAGGNAWTQGIEVPSYVQCRGRESLQAARRMEGGAVEKRKLVVVDAATCPVTPARGDRIALGSWSSDAGAEWMTITNAYPGREGAAVRVWRLEVAA